MNRSYRKEILEVLKKEVKYSDLATIDFKWLAEKAGIKVAKVKEAFKNMDDVFHQVSLEFWDEHDRKSKKIIQLKGDNALATLIRHDLNNVYLYLKNTPNEELEDPKNKTVLFVRDYIENGMPNNYFNLLRLNPELIPDTNMNIQVYAHFIVHSLFFSATSRVDTIKSMDSEEFKAPTRQIINALFKPKTNLV